MPRKHIAQSAGGCQITLSCKCSGQGDVDVFKRYSQAKLAMMRVALAKLDRNANQPQTFGTAVKS
jgi:hypothetical protein